MGYLYEAHNPYTSIGKYRYLNAIERFKKLINHEWFKELLGKRRQVKVIDLCGGSGIGGIALCKVLQELNYDTELTVLDIRKDALEICKKFAKEELNINVNTVLKDVREYLKFDYRFDLVLIYGASTIYFSPWEWVKILLNISENITNDGLFINDDVDRMYTIIYQYGYKNVLIEHTSRDKLVISIHEKYDFKTGIFKRIFYNMLKSEIIGSFNLFFWSIADLSTYTWLFFKDIDVVIQDLTKPWQVFIIAREPRRKFNLNELSVPPKLFSK